MYIWLFILICILAGVLFYTKNYTIEGMSTGGGRCPNMLIQKGSFYYLYNTKLAEVPGVNPIIFNNLEEYVEFLDWQRSQGIRCPVLYLQETYDSQGNMTYKVRPGVTDIQGGLPPTTASLDAKVTQFPDVHGMPAMMNQTPSDQTGYSGKTEQTNQPGQQGGSPPTNAASLGTKKLKRTPIQPEMPPMTPSLASQFAINPNNRYPNLKRTLLVDATIDDPPYNTNSYPAYDRTSYYSGKHTPLDQLDVINESKEVSPNPMDPNWGGAEYTQHLVDEGYYKDNEVMIAVA